MRFKNNFGKRFGAMRDSVCCKLRDTWRYSSGLLHWKKKRRGDIKVKPRKRETDPTTTETHTLPLYARLFLPLHYTVKLSSPLRSKHTKKKKFN